MNRDRVRSVLTLEILDPEVCFLIRTAQPKDDHLYSTIVGPDGLTDSYSSWPVIGIA